MEMAQEGRKEAGELGRTVKGVCIPYSVLSVKNVRAAAGQNAGTAADGGNLIQTSGPTYIEALRANLVMQKLGAKFLTGLIGTLSFVKNSKVDISWAGEAETVENEKISFSLQEMKQKRLVITTAFTKDLPITDRAHDYAEDLVRQLKAAGIRAEGDFRSEKLGYKIREAQKEKIPYMLVVGDKEAENGTVAVRTRSGGDEGVMDLQTFLTQRRQEIDSKSKRV